MKISVLTVFPELVQFIAQWGILGKAIESRKITFSATQLRDFTHDTHRTTDDYPFGGGPGMVMKPEPIFEWWDREKASELSPWVIFPSPQGRPFDTEIARKWSKMDHIAFICGRYEGLDERVMTLVHEEVSLGDFVTSGGELPVMIMVDAISRFVEGVVGNADSVKNDSFAHGWLDYGHYTRPAEFRSMKVPETLLSGDHKKIFRRQKRESIIRTMAKRPDLFRSKEFTEEEREWILDIVIGAIIHQKKKKGNTDA